MVQGLDQRRGASGCRAGRPAGRVALHHPHVAQHLVEHARRAAGAALPWRRRFSTSQARAEQADDDLAVGERGVVVGNLAQSRASPSAAAAGTGHAANRGQGCVFHESRGGRFPMLALEGESYRSAPFPGFTGLLPWTAGVAMRRPTRPSNPHGDVMRTVRLALAAAAFAAATLPAHAQTEIQWWHSMTGGLNDWGSTWPTASTPARRTTRSCRPTRARTTSR